MRTTVAFAMRCSAAYAEPGFGVQRSPAGPTGSVGIGIEGQDAYGHGARFWVLAAAGPVGLVLKCKILSDGARGSVSRPHQRKQIGYHAEGKSPDDVALNIPRGEPSSAFG